MTKVTPLGGISGGISFFTKTYTIETNGFMSSVQILWRQYCLALSGRRRIYIPKPRATALTRLCPGLLCYGLSGRWNTGFARFYINCAPLPWAVMRRAFSPVFDTLFFIG